MALACKGAEFKGALGEARRPRSAEVKRAPDAAMPSGEVLPLLGGDVGDVLPLLAADVGDVRTNAHGSSLVGVTARLDPCVTAHISISPQGRCGAGWKGLQRSEIQTDPLPMNG